MGLDGSAPGPGQTATPNLDSPDGTHAPSDLNAEYAVAVGGVAIAAPKVATVGGMELYRLGGEPVRLRETRTGVAADGWMGEHATYTRYDVAGLGRGYVKVSLSREAACCPDLAPAVGTVEVGPVAIGESEQPTIGQVTAASRDRRCSACQPNAGRAPGAGRAVARRGERRPDVRPARARPEPGRRARARRQGHASSSCPRGELAQREQPLGVLAHEAAPSRAGARACGGERKRLSITAA